MKDKSEEIKRLLSFGEFSMEDLIDDLENKASEFDYREKKKLLDELEASLDNILSTDKKMNLK